MLVALSMKDYGKMVSDKELQRSPRPMGINIKEYGLMVNFYRKQKMPNGKSKRKRKKGEKEMKNLKIHHEDQKIKFVLIESILYTLFEL